MNFNLKEIILIFLKGLFMGSADIVPGVSGGTIALITGIYERLISAISSIRFSFLKPLLKGNFTDFKEKLIEEIDFELFIPLILGIGIAFISLAKVISYLLDTQTAYTFSFFLGLILASAYILYTKLDNFNIKLIIISIIGIILSYIFVGLNPIATNHSLVVIFISGLIAICAMILPGISGSFLLLLLGQYQYMLNALNSRNLIEILVFGIGGLVLANDMTKNMTDMSIQHSEEVASQEEEEAKHWNEAIEESYSFYVDGSEVDPDNIDRNQYYEITFDDDAYKVFLSN